MSNIIIIGFATEGSTDVRFLESVIRRTFEDVAFECNSLPEIHSVQHISTKKEEFVKEILQAAEEASNIGVMVLCVHTDADDSSDESVYNNKIIPAFEVVEKTEGIICKNLVAVVPVYMTEAWMLADVDLLKEEIGTNKSLNDLGLNRTAQSISDPKKVIKDAIQIAFADQTQRKRKRSIEISELYLPIGQRIPLRKLEELSSYQKFKDGVREAYRKLNYLH